MSIATEYRYAQKVSEHLPQSPGKYAQVIERVISSATPRKRKHLEKKGLYSEKRRKLYDSYADSCKEYITGLKKKLTEKNRQAYITIAKAFSGPGRKPVVGTKTYLQKKLGISWEIQKRAKAAATKRKIRSDKISPDLTAKIQNFWLSQEVSRAMPSKKDVRKKAATHVLEMTESEAWHKFKKENPNEH